MTTAELLQLPMSTRAVESVRTQLAYRPRPQAKARLRHTPGAMNGTERRYMIEVLEPAKVAGRISEYHFERVKIRLADRTHYTPDFFVVLPDGLIEMHEVKGFWEDDARVKIKVAAEVFPARFIAVTPMAKKHGGGWKVEEFNTGTASSPEQEQSHTPSVAADFPPEHLFEDRLADPALDYPGFARFWDAYPRTIRKVGRKQCFVKWRKRKLEPMADRVIAGLEWWKKQTDWIKDGGAFICAPVVWLNSDRWEAATEAKSVWKPSDQTRMVLI